ncbi:A24 family peptidase [Sphingobium sp. HBC34]|uniref:Prepilin leader peptidase/N-methyltransferase n=1 Tax=Sphingobium cyanobacteriorum TaxID=3063954 RepID=A0ABT8ZPI4_9SPHN|nr:A24 family peptidase [Sphingobium sp. HBC34]MDO7836106.1 A24 family peptidase [Sphingobium sp. HBC34]
MIQPVPALVGALAGMILGSFLATLILRWPQGRSMLRGRSACDGCGRTLGARDLIPMVSAMMSKGRCRTCGGRIDPLHGRVEAGCAIIGALAIGFRPDLGGVAWALLGWVLLTLAVLDWRHFWLPDALTLPMAFLGFTIGAWATDVAMGDRIVGAVAGYGTLLAIAIGYKAVRRRDGLGMGDAKLLGALGAWFGWQALPFILLLAALLGLAVALATGRAKGSTHVPLGTFLALAAFPAWLVTMSIMA